MPVNADTLADNGPDHSIETGAVSAPGEHSNTHGGFLPMGFTAKLMGRCDRRIADATHCAPWHGQWSRPKGEAP
ncbi:hypothetical protein GCM10010404_44960 [Nonomuraea africana]